MSGKGLLQGLHTAAKGTAEFAKKHPVPVMFTAGTGIGVARAETPYNQAQDEIMREYLKAPGAKYSSCTLLDQFTERKMYLSSKVAFEKKATLPDEKQPSFDQTLTTSTSSAVGKGVVNEGIAALRRLIGASAQTIADRFVAEPKRKKIVNEVIRKDPVIHSAERENPGQVAQAYGTMKRFAPTLSTDPNVVTSFLRNTALTGGPMDFQTIKGLADAEAAVQRAKSEGAWLKGGF
jgi:hypothetical protein